MAQDEAPVFARTDPRAEAADSEREAADIIARLGPVADQLGSRGAVAQFEAEIGDMARTRAGSGFAGFTGPLPRFMPMRDIVRISINLIDIVGSPSIPRQLARTTRLPTDDNLTNAVPYAPTLRDAQVLGMRYNNVMLPWFVGQIVVTGNEVHLAFRPVTSLGRIEPISTELMLMAHQRAVETFMTTAAVGARMHFALQPASDPGLIAERCGCRVTVGGGVTHIAFPLEWWTRTSPYHDPVLWREGLARCEADLVAVREPPLIGRVRAHVAQGLDARRIVTIAETAQSLDVAPRSLMRALSDLGTTHHKIADCERRDRARDLLAQTMMPIADVAEQLVFSDQSSFGRKCHGWFGASPARFRRNLAGKGRLSA